MRRERSAGVWRSIPPSIRFDALSQTPLGKKEPIASSKESIETSLLPCRGIKTSYKMQESFKLRKIGTKQP